LFFLIPSQVPCPSWISRIPGARVAGPPTLPPPPHPPCRQNAGKNRIRLFYFIINIWCLPPFFRAHFVFFFSGALCFPPALPYFIGKRGPVPVFGGVVFHVPTKCHVGLKSSGGVGSQCFFLSKPSSSPSRLAKNNITMLMDYRDRWPKNACLLWTFFCFFPFFPRLGPRCNKRTHRWGVFFSLAGPPFGRKRRGKNPFNWNGNRVVARVLPFFFFFSPSFPIQIMFPKSVTCDPSVGWWGPASGGPEPPPLTKVESPNGAPGRTQQTSCGGLQSMTPRVPLLPVPKQSLPLFPWSGPLIPKTGRYYRIFISNFLYFFFFQIIDCAKCLAADHVFVFPFFIYFSDRVIAFGFPVLLPVCSSPHLLLGPRRPWTRAGTIAQRCFW